MHRCVELWSIESVRDKVRDTDSDYVLSIATKIVPAGPVRGILLGGHQVFSTILMYTAKRGRGTILVAIESNEKAIDCSALGMGVATDRATRSVLPRAMR